MIDLNAPLEKKHSGTEINAAASESLTSDHHRVPAVQECVGPSEPIRARHSRVVDLGATGQTLNTNA